MALPLIYIVVIMHDIAVTEIHFAVPFIYIRVIMDYFAALKIYIAITEDYFAITGNDILPPDTGLGVL